MCIFIIHWFRFAEKSMTLWKVHFAAGMSTLANQKSYMSFANCNSYFCNPQNRNDAIFLAGINGWNTYLRIRKKIQCRTFEFSCGPMIWLPLFAFFYCIENIAHFYCIETMAISSIAGEKEEKPLVDCSNLWERERSKACFSPLHIIFQKWSENKNKNYNLDWNVWYSVLLASRRCHIMLTNFKIEEKKYDSTVYI